MAPRQPGTYFCSFVDDYGRGEAKVTPLPPKLGGSGLLQCQKSGGDTPDKQSGSSPSTVETTGKTQSSAFLGQKAFKGQPYALPLFVVELKVHLKLY